MNRFARTLCGLAFVLAAVLPGKTAFAVWSTYKAFGDLQDWPTLTASSSSFNQAANGARMQSCDAGTWTKYQEVRNSTTILHGYEGSSCTYIYFGTPHIDYYTKTACSDKSGGNHWASCQRSYP